jgi:two-component system, sensor histidine kinase PdtaS
MKTRTVFLLAFHAILTLTCGAQQQEPLTKQLKDELLHATSDTAKVRIYLRLGAAFLRDSYDSSEYYVRQAFALAEQEGFKKGEFKSLVQLGTIAKNKGNYEQAISHYEAAFPLATQSGDSGLLFNNLGSTYLKIGSLDSALSNLLKSLEIKVRTHDEEGMVNSYINIGNFYLLRKEPATARQYYRKGLEIEKKFNDPSRLGKLYKNLGNIFYEFSNLDSAEYFYNSALDLQKNGNNVQVDLGGLYLNLGNIHKQRGNPDKAMNFYRQSLSLHQKAGDSYRTVNSLMNIGNLYEEEKKYTDALYYYQEALKNARLANSPDQEKAVLYNLSVCYEKSGNYSLALFYHKSAQDFSEKLYNKEKAEMLAEMRTKFDTQQKEKELVLEKASSEKKNYERNIFIITSVLLLILLCVLVFIYLRTRSLNIKLAMQKKVIEKKESEKGLLLRELHHRTKNNLQLVSSLLNLQAHQLKDTEAAHAVKEGQTRVEAMALIHRDLYKKENVTHVNLKTYLENMINNLISTYNFSRSSIIVNMDIEGIELEADLAIPLGLIANELLSNAFKHAFKHQALPELFVAGKEMPTGELYLTVHDNGKGIDNTPSAETTFGMKMTHSLVKQLQGTISFENRNGCFVSVAVPLKKEELIEA